MKRTLFGFGAVIFVICLLRSSDCYVHPYLSPWYFDNDFQQFTEQSFNELPQKLQHLQQLVGSTTSPMEPEYISENFKPKDPEGQKILDEILSRPYIAAIAPSFDMQYRLALAEDLENRGGHSQRKQ
uniref:Uncharacterized protein n=1 Tax=Syphacia muris TaxID=451379 RepID=A0A0N5AIM7_9BILA